MCGGSEGRRGCVNTSSSGGMYVCIPLLRSLSAPPILPAELECVSHAPPPLDVAQSRCVGRG